MENQPNQPQKGGNKALWIVLVIVILAIAGYGIYAYISGNTNNANMVSNTNSATNTNENINAVANTNVDTSGWKTYTNTKYGYTIKIPQSWGRVSELDGSLDTNLNKQSTQDSSSIVLGPSDAIEGTLSIQIGQNKTIDEFLEEDTYSTGSGTVKFILGSSDFTTASGIEGKLVSLDSSHVWYNYAYVFPKGNNLIDLRFLKGNNDALASINSLEYHYCPNIS